MLYVKASFLPFKDQKQRKDIPCQSVHKKLFTDNIAEELKKTKLLKNFLALQRFLFMKVVIMHIKGEFSKIRGSFCNIPIEIEMVCKVLPRGADSNDLILVK